MLGSDDLGVRAENRRPFNDVFQLPNVPGPPVHLERSRCLVGQMLGLLTLLRLELQKVPRDRVDILWPLPQRRQRDGKDIQAIVEILPELARANDLLQQRTGS